MDYPTHLLVLRTPLLIYRHQRRMTELCINLPSGIYLSASFSSFQACILAQGIVPTAGCCVGVGSRHVETVFFLFFLVLSYLHYNNDRIRYITVSMYVAAAGFLHHVSDVCSPPGFFGNRPHPCLPPQTVPFFADVTGLWRNHPGRSKTSAGARQHSFFTHTKEKGTAPLNEAARFSF